MQAGKPEFLLLLHIRGRATEQTSLVSVTSWLTAHRSAGPGGFEPASRISHALAAAIILLLCLVSSWEMEKEAQ